MDEEKHILPEQIASEVPHRKGFALIVTLSALAVIIALSSVLISYVDEARKDSSSTKAMIQGNLYYSDIKKIFTKFKKRKVLYTTLYLSPIPFATEDGRFSIVVQCTPLAKGVNINWLGFENNEKMTEQFSLAQEIFEKIAQEYDLEDTSRLEEMILEEVGRDTKFVQKEYSRLRQKNGIISSKQFESILDRYQFETDDIKVGRVPWEKFFVFNKIDTENLMDGDYISSELVALIFAMDFATVKEEWMPGMLSLKTFVDENGGMYEQKLFAKDFLAQSQCEVQYDYEGERFAFRFEDIEGEVKNFEFYGKQ